MVTVWLAEPRMDPHHTPSEPGSVDILILGAGWTSRFLIPLLREHGVTYAATSTSGRDGTLPFKFDPASDAEEPYAGLPAAKTILITFPLRGAGQSQHLTTLYNRTHQPSSPAARASTPPPPQDGTDRQWIQLGTTGIFTGSSWSSSTSPYDVHNPRAVAEDELQRLAGGCVLNLAGLYDGAVRDPRDWLARVAKTKEQLGAKGSLHLVHGVDVARAVLALHANFTPGRRWIVADLHVYDWWDLALAWGEEARRRAGEGVGPAEELQFERWVAELMDEHDVRALPRGVERLGRLLDSREFWKTMGIQPKMKHVLSELR